ncbi:MAG: class II fructose-bisphosphate aldolase [Balneolaceae bacterium]
MKKQREKNGSLIAFNVQNITHLEILKNCTSNLELPVIAQLSSRYIPYWEQRIGLKNLINSYQNELLFFHLDHCNKVETIKQCIDSGFSGVMYDGSSYQIDVNIKETNQVFEYIKSNNKDVVLEAELGSIVGIEDGFKGALVADYYSPKDLDVFLKNANFDVLALAIGNAHGVYETTSDVKPELLLQATRKNPTLNLVLHGGTGLPDSMIKKCIKYGVVKINVSTELKIKTQLALKKYVNKSDSFNESDWFEEANTALTPFFENYIKKYTK